MLDPLTLASVSSALTLLSSEVAKGIAGDAGKDAWKKIKSLFGWHEEPQLAAIPEMTAKALEASPELANEVKTILSAGNVGSAGQLVGTIHAEKVVVIGVNQGGVTM
ncbi:MAG TPA: hypothetical protein VHE55_00520 [Fimbriimonadaceae bacterium]|nr:hypothetical protein [Fimbriimonadaceae bacterium]